MTPEAAFLGGIIVILLSSRLLGEAAQRVGQPAVIGQLVAGILLGPSFFGLLWPQLQSTLFPDEAVQKAMLDGIAQFGVLLLLLLTGMDTDLRLIQRIGRPVVTISLFGVLVPFLCGMLLGFEAPSHFVPDPDRRLITALFLGVALSISSIKIVAMVVNGMNFARRDLGQLIVTSAIAEDSIGWILIAVTFGIANSGRIDLLQLARTLGGIAIFLVVSLTLGRRVVSTAIRFVNDNFVSECPVVTLILVVMGGMALITKGLGVQTVLGAFVAGVIIGESPILTKHIAGQLRGMVASLFAPIFFALAGLRSDLTILSAPAAAELTAALVLIASVGKFAGAFIGGAIGRLSRAESLALAIGMNARGSTEVIIATIGLSIGVLTHTLYSMIVTMAVLTTLAMPPTLRWALARLPFRPGEEKRLEQEAFEARGFVANLERFLIAADDRPDGRLASRLAGLLAGSTGQPITMLPIHSEAENGLATARSESALDLLRGADHAREGRPGEEARAPDIAVKAREERLAFPELLSEEAPKGYDFLILGLSPAHLPGGGFNPKIVTAARSFDGPVSLAIARGVHERDPTTGPLSLLVPIAGTATSRRGAEIAIELARAARAQVTVVFVSPLTVAGRSRSHSRWLLARRHEDSVIREIVELAEHRDQRVRVRSLRSDAWRDAILQEAERLGATMIVLGVDRRSSDALLFGETADHLLERSARSLLFVAS